MQVKKISNVVSCVEAMEQIARTWLDDATRLVLGQVQQNTRVDTSATKLSWDRVVEDTKGYVGSPNINAIWEEFGTGVYAKDGRKSPWYVPVDGYLGHKKPTFNGKVCVVYGKNGQKFYKTDGKKGTHAFMNAHDSTLPAIERRLKMLCAEKMQ